MADPGVRQSMIKNFKKIKHHMVLFCAASVTAGGATSPCRHHSYFSAQRRRLQPVGTAPPVCRAVPRAACLFAAFPVGSLHVPQRGKWQLYSYDAARPRGPSVRGRSGCRVAPHPAPPRPPASFAFAFAQKESVFVDADTVILSCWGVRVNSDI
jgi:hypothetical protein